MENCHLNRNAGSTRSPPTPITPVSSSATEELKAIPTPELQQWMSTIDQCLNDVCTIATDGKLNSDQKMRISSLCRKVSYGTSQLVVQYQSLKLKANQAQTSMIALQNQLDLTQSLRDLKSSIEVTSKPAPGSSFADIVKKGENKFIQPSNISSVVIYPTDKKKSSEETKSLIQKIISPELMKLHIRGLRKTKNGGVIISTDSKDDIEKLKQYEHLINSGLTLDEPHKRKPRVVVIGVPIYMQESEVLNCLYHQNLADSLQDINLETFLASIKLSHKSGKKDAEFCNYVIEVSASIRKALITKDRIFIKWSSCPVRDFTLVTRCYKCQQYGHAAKTCREPTTTCGHCGGGGHSIKECPKTSEEPKCATCQHFKKPSNHNTGAAICPAKIMAEKRYINSIDYDGA